MKSKKSRGAAPSIVTETDPKSAAAEAYRTLRTNLHFAEVDRPQRTIAVTSATAGEGKTTTVANLGVVAAQAGARVCLIDGDLRRPALHRLFGLENNYGLTTALVDGLSLENVAQPTRVQNLSLVPSGPLAPNPAELAASRRMHEFFESAVPSYDLVICDTPPVMSVADALALSALCDGVLLVVYAGRIPPEVVRRVAEQIEGVKSRIIGVVLNGVNLRRDAYYSDYYRYYYTYYSDSRS